MAKGWISLHRQIWESWIWKDKPFSKGQAWIDLLLLVNHKDDKTLIDNKLITVLRGSHITSQLKLMDRWGWGKERVRNFLKLLEADGMILVETTTRYTLITITNYDTYQNQTDSKLDISTVTDEPQTEVRPKSDQSQTEVRPVADRTPSTNNNVNKVNKNIYTPEFEKVWSFYPNPNGKRESFDKYEKLTKQYTDEQMIEAIKVYAKEVKGQERKFIKHGSTFFNKPIHDYIEKLEKVKAKSPIEPLKAIIVKARSASDE